MTMAMIASAAITVGGGMVAANKQSKAAKAAAEAGKAIPVDIDEVSGKAEAQAQRNLARSIALEQQYDPYVAQARKAAAMNFASAVGKEDPLKARAKQMAMQMADGPAADYDSPALREAVGQALAASKGPAIPYAELPVEVSNLATRKALGTAARTGGGGLGLGRDLVARDLGLTSLQLGQQAEDIRMKRLAQLLGAGGDEVALNAGKAQFGLNQKQNILSNLSQLGGQDYAQALSAAQFTQGLQRPVVGLDPTAIANLATGNVSTENANRRSNANMIMNQGNIEANLIGNIAGTVGGVVSNRFGQPKKGGATGYLDVGAMY